MQCGEEGTNNNSVLDKETLQLSPHIAAHKSSTNVISIPFMNDNFSSDNQSSPRLIAVPSNAIYKVNASSVPAANFDLPYSIRSPVLHSSLSHPEDLSATPLKIPIIAAESTTKNLPVVHPVISQAIDGFTGSLIVADRNQTFYSFTDGTTVAITGQHPAVFVSPVNSGTNNEAYRNRVESSTASSTIITSSIESSSSNPDINTLSFHQPGLHDGQIIVPEILSGQIIWDDLEVKKIKNEDDAESKDLVRQALQAAVSHGSPRVGNDELISPDYGSHDCISEDGVCHSTFTVQNKPQEVIMMSGHLGPVQNNAKYIGTVGTFLPAEVQNGTQVLVLQTAAMTDAVNNPTVDLSSRQKRLQKEVAQPRRKNVANRMKEKRANESEDQRKRRRSREAERMRKKRLQEDETTKQRRRHEAADRARKRRANLSPSERDVERNKAAQRMRMRRLKENEGERKVRRDKAAERMRVRRSQETPGEKAIRKSMSSKLRLKKKKEDDPLKNEETVKGEKSDLLAIASPLYSNAGDSPSSFQYKNKDSRVKSDSALKVLESADHAVQNTSSSNFTLLSNVLHNEGKFIQVPLADYDTRSVELRSLSSSESSRVCGMPVSPQHMTVNKRIVNQAPPSYSESVSPTVATDAQNDLLPLQKPSAAHLGIHHLPHLLHHQHLSSYTVDHQYHSDQAPTHVKNH